jgi:hypothetical protein
MLWVDKHRPTSLEKLDYHKEQALQLQSLAASGELPHLLGTSLPNLCAGAVAGNVGGGQPDARF